MPRHILLPVAVCALVAGAACWNAALRAGQAPEPPVAVNAPQTAAEAVDFNRDIRPLLSDRCFRCHGPDEAARQSGLRLDTFDGATADRDDGKPAIVPGAAARSRLIARVSATDPDHRMPPVEAKKPALTAHEVDLFRRWIDGGAAYSRHWSFRPPERTAPPPVAQGDWPAGEIDRFLLARMEATGLAPSPPADRRTLIRRVTLDLTGLPPTPDEVAAFVADDAPDAYDRLVDRLLASPRFGERMAVEWMDAARYGDTNGYHIDNERTMWRWRDWVIDAYNRNMAFDQFTIEQIAGDLLPDAQPAQRVASGFHRNHMINFEGGAIPEEYHNAYVVDRVNTTSTVWLGLTINCAQCHDHKFDPITQEEYYRLYAFFNTIDEQGLDGQKGNSVPNMPAPTPEQGEKFDAERARLTELETRLAAPIPELDEKQAAWESTLAADDAKAWSILRPFTATATGGATLQPQPDGSLLAEGALPERDDYEIVTFTDRTDIAALRLEALGDPRIPNGGPGRPMHSNFVLSEIELQIAPVADPAAAQPVRFVAAHADYSQPGFHVSRAIDGKLETGWAVGSTAIPGRDRIAVFVAEQPFGFAGGTVMKFKLRHQSPYTQHSIGRVRLAFAGASPLGPRIRPTRMSAWNVSSPLRAAAANGAFAEVFAPERDANSPLRDADPATVTWTPKPDFADGAPHELGDTPNAAVYLFRELQAPSAREMLVSLGSDDGLKVWLNGELVHSKDVPRGVAPDQDFVTLRLREGENHVLLKVSNLAGPAAFYFEPRRDDSLDPPLDVARFASVPSAERSDAQKKLLRDHFRQAESPAWREIREQERAARSAFDALSAAVPTTMVMAEMTAPRDTFVLTRGLYDQPTHKVAPGVPAALGPLPDGERADRLALARWLVSRDNPLTARVTVNRLWQMLFGVGIVKTAEDFGSQGEWPSHRELLDWLAVELMDSGWDTRHMLRLMVTSSAYRQSARVSPAALERDPENRLLSRAPRPRLPAELLRDNALAISGLLVERIGGPSVRVYQPAGLWEECSLDPTGASFTAQVFKQDRGEALHRRSLYVYVKRSIPPPTLNLFDAPSREFCVVRRSRTNTPLQALVVMNDPTYVEAARAFAERLLRESPADDVPPEARLARAYEIALARPPAKAESAALLELLRAQREQYAAAPETAARLIAIGDSVPDAALDPVELAAWTCITSVILNLDETITRG